MSFIHNNALAGASGQGGAYEIEQSLRFDQGGYFSRTFSSSGDRNNWTFSVWLKRSGGIGDNDRDIFCGYNSGARLGLIECGTGYPGGPADQFGVDRGGDASAGVYYTNGRYRDPSAWYHLVVSVDYTNATQANRARIFVNGVNYGAAYNDLASGDGQINGNWSHWIGQRDGGSTSNRWDGYMAELHFLDGITVTDASSFGESDANGVWRPIEYTGSHGTNGFYLTFDPSATNGIGHDHSGNGNNWTPTGFTTSGTGTDVMSDTPTTNWATLNPLSPSQSEAVLANGNLDCTWTGVSGHTRRSTIAVGSGKWYAEITRGTSTLSVGLVDADLKLLSWPGNSTYGSTGSYAYRTDDGNKYNNGSGSSYGSTVATGDVIGIAYDGDNGALYFSKNGIWQNSGDPTSGASATGAAFTGLGNQTWTIACGNAGGSTNGTATNFNFGQREFANPPGTIGATDYFNTVTYTGTGGTKAVSGVGFQPDLVWIKNRSRDGSSHVLVDAVRGATKALSSNLANAEVTTNGTDDFRSFDSDGFTVGDSSNYFVNSIGDTHVAWCWKAGGTAVSNTDGTLTSSVSANQDAGFSIVSYTGNWY
jgi:hypothetical protein